MHQVHDSSMWAKGFVDDKDKEVDTCMCMLEGHERRIKNIDVELEEIKRDRLLVEDYESLARRATDLEEVLFELQVATKRLLKDVKI